MKVLACYAITTKVDIPEEKIKEIMTEPDNLRQGDLFNQAIQEHSDTLKCVFSYDAIDGEITGVYNPCFTLPTGEIAFENQDFDEVFWEN